MSDIPVGAAGGDAVKVTGDVLRSTAGHVRGVKQNLDGQLSQIGNHIASLESAWGGKSAGTFTGIMVNWRKHSVALNSALESIAKNMNTSADTFDAADDDNQRLVVKAAASGPLQLN